MPFPSLPPRSIVHLVRLMQLMIEYRLYCQEAQFGAIQELTLRNDGLDGGTMELQKKGGLCHCPLPSPMPNATPNPTPNPNPNPNPTPNTDPDPDPCSVVGLMEDVKIYKRQLSVLRRR